MSELKEHMIWTYESDFGLVYLVGKYAEAAHKDRDGIPQLKSHLETEILDVIEQAYKDGKDFPLTLGDGE